MKIYCSRDKQYTLYDFIGQDVFVKCRNVWGESVFPPSYFYIKIAYLEDGSHFADGKSRFYGTILDYDAVHDEYNHHENIDKDAIICDLSRHTQFGCNDYKVVTPLDIITTDEILDIIFLTSLSIWLTILV